MITIALWALFILGVSLVIYVFGEDRFDNTIPSTGFLTEEQALADRWNQIVELGSAAKTEADVRQRQVVGDGAGGLAAIPKAARTARGTLGAAKRAGAVPRAVVAHDFGSGLPSRGAREVLGSFALNRDGSD